jgi:hypothetical protein
VEVAAEPAERLRVAIDDRDFVSEPLEGDGQRGTDAATAHDHDVHFSLPRCAVR